MPRLIELLAFDVPQRFTPERSPSKIVPCPFCRRFYVIPRDTQFIKLACEERRADFAELIDMGLAPRVLVDAFLTGEPLPKTSDLWRLQPAELWCDVRQISDALVPHMRAVDLQ